jgi:filamentous hemagglutinin family protein
MRNKFKLILAYHVATAALMSGVAQADPTGGVIVDGTGVVNPVQGQTTRIDQSSERLIIDWSSFDVASNERVIFDQPSADAIALNRILSGAPSMIAGQVTANGRVFLINADGVVFTSSAKVDVNGLLATTMDIANADFMAGNYEFSQPGNINASIINRGDITAADAGMIAFVAPQVENAGLLRARMGSVALASGEAFTLDFFGDALIAFAAVNTAGNKIGSILNTGEISAPDGVIALTATAARDFVNSVINVEADLVADSASMVGGKIILTGGEQSAVTVSADLNASGRDGGRINIIGGEVLIADNARLIADADQGMGDGGAISVNSFTRTDFRGVATATPGSSAGTAGDITLASDGVLIINGQIISGGGTGGGTSGGGSGGGSTGGGAGGGSTGGGAGGGSTGGGSTGSGGTTPVVVLAPVLRAQAEKALTEVATTGASPVYAPEEANSFAQQSAAVVFDDTVASGLTLDGAGETNKNASFLCLYDIAEAACTR